jgi:FkbM family methyltransferase
MRLADFSDWFALRKHLLRPWDFLRLRKNPPTLPHVDLPLRGGGVLRMRADSPDRHIIQGVFARDEYRLDGVAPGSLGTVIDVGAHIGTFALRASAVAARVLAFEPIDDSFELLRRNTAHRPNVQAFQRCVAGKTGPVTLFLGKNSSAHSIHPAEGAPRATKLELQALSLADIFAEHGVDRCAYLKLDCEGAEYEILLSLAPELLRRIDRIGMEYHSVECGPLEWTGQRLAEHLRQGGHETELVPSKNRHGKGLLFSRLRA